MNDKEWELIEERFDGRFMSMSLHDLKLRDVEKELLDFIRTEISKAEKEAREKIHTGTINLENVGRMMVQAKIEGAERLAEKLLQEEELINNEFYVECLHIKRALSEIIKEDK